MHRLALQPADFAGRERIEPAVAEVAGLIANHVLRRDDGSGLVVTLAGTVPIQGGVVEIGVDGQPCAVNGSLDLSGIRTGNQRRDSDLRRPRLLDLEDHPVMTFTADSFDGWRIEGSLDARGTCTRVAGTVEPILSWDDDTVTLQATTTFDRRNLGVRAPRFLIGHDIDIEVRVRVRLDQGGA